MGTPKAREGWHELKAPDGGPGLALCVRGWLHGNCVFAPGPDGATLVDTGYHTGAPELVAGLRARLAPLEPLERLVLTHVHSDHAGAGAVLQERWPGLRTAAHDDARDLVTRWDRDGLWLTGTGQEMPRLRIEERIEPGEELVMGGRSWTALHTPGHATGGLSFWSEATGWLITGDALWQDGFGLLNPWMDGPGVFQEAAQALDRIEATGARLAIPGHGLPFTDVAAAVARARSRLAYLRAHPQRHLAQLLRNLVGFLGMARPELSTARLRAQAIELGAAYGATRETVVGALARSLGPAPAGSGAVTA